MDSAAIDWNSILEGIDWTTLFHVLITVVFTLVGAWFGNRLGHRSTMQLEETRRAQELRELLGALYAEVADRAARCLNDYIDPWQHFGDRNHPPAEIMSVARVGKFRPHDPVIYPQVAARIGQVGAGALPAVIQFYFRLDAIRREIDNLLADFSADTNLRTSGHYARAELVSRRFHEALGPALVALERLPIENSEAFDAAAVSSYQQIETTGVSLRAGLEQYRQQRAPPTG